MGKIKTILLVLSSLFLVHCSSWAKEITILYTGSTHAMIYPCSCPLEPDGGIARRATLINELKKSNPDTLLLDAGAFIAGGLFDEYTQNAELDSKRSKVNLKAMELMRYDAVNISDNEFNFGRKFLEDCLNGIKMPYLSSNIKLGSLAPFIIKDVGGVKVGIIGVSGVFSEQKAGGLKPMDPAQAVKGAVGELRKNSADIIVLLSSAGVEQDFDLAKEISGIDVIIESAGKKETQMESLIGSVIFAGASWQGKKLGKLNLTVKDKKIINHSIEEVRLSDKISDDQSVLSVLPKCFSDNNCKKNGSIGICRNPGELLANCSFPESSKVNLVVIKPKQCQVCNTDMFVSYLKTEFPGLVVAYLFYPDKEAKELINDFGIRALPVYLLGKEVEGERGFENLKRNLENKGSYYMLKMEFTGVSYFLGRPASKGKLDLFISLYQKGAKDYLDLAREYSPEIHFLAVENREAFEAARGNLEVEDYLRGVCVKKYYPEKFWDYIGCRAKNANSSWWQDCLLGADAEKIKICAQGKEGVSLLRENIRLNKELQVMLGPIFLLGNQEVFGFKDLPTKEQLKKLIKR